MATIFDPTGTITFTVQRFTWIKIERLFMAFASDLGISPGNWPAKIEIENPLSGKTVTFSGPVETRQGGHVTKVTYTDEVDLRLILYNE